MNLHGFLFRLLCVLTPVAIVANTYLYAYPFFHGCAFAVPHSQNEGIPDAAPFRLLAFGDPQLEGDTSLPRKPDYTSFDRDRIGNNFRDRDLRSAWIHVQDITEGLKDRISFKVDLCRKQLDLLGNDYYLAHIYRTLHWYTKPTHLTVLGDLLGSQWIDDEEFASRSWRFWNRVFRGTSVVPDNRLSPAIGDDGSVAVHEEILEDDGRWSNRIINVPGNHDIGYAGDIDRNRVMRFEREFGPVNGDIRFKLVNGHHNSSEPVPTLRLVMLNSMNIDQPQQSQDLAGETVYAINRAIGASRPVETHDEAIILLTHIPLHKDAGVCPDEPMFSYFDDGTIREQNFLSYDVGKNAILQGLFGKSPFEAAPARGLGRDGIILTGHDHEGCDVYHHVVRESGQWQATRWTDTETAGLVNHDDRPGIREVTVRSMMGEFAGNVALASAWWDQNAGRWKIEVNNCGFVVQHIWWAVHVMDFIILLLSIVAILAYASQNLLANYARKNDDRSFITCEQTSISAQKLLISADDMVPSLVKAGQKSLRKKRRKPI